MVKIYLKYCFFTLLVITPLQVMALQKHPIHKKHHKARTIERQQEKNTLTPEQKKKQIKRILDEKMIHNRHIDSGATK